MVKTDDRRVRKTRKSIRDCLAELMLEKDLARITVQELSDKADIHRGTFYAHYHDVFDAYEKMELAFIVELGAIIEEASDNTYEEMFRSIINFVYENGRVCRMFIGNRGDNSFYERIGEFLEEKYLETWTLEFENFEATEEVRYIVTYHIQGCLAIIARWVSGGFSTSKEEVTALIIRVDDHFEKLFI